AGGLSVNWEGAPSRAARTTSRDRLNGANRSQDQSMRASSVMTAGGAAGATGAVCPSGVCWGVGAGGGAGGGAAAGRPARLAPPEQGDPQPVGARRRQGV